MNEEKVTDNLQGPPPPTKKKRSCLWLIILIILLLLGGAYYWYSKNGLPVIEKENPAETGFSGELKAVDPEVDADRKISKTLTSAGGVMQVEAADGTLYTLTVPEEALILPSTVEMTPLSKSPIENYGTPTTGFGVSLSGKFDFIRPAYLTIQPKTKKPAEKPAANYCSVGSRIYNPELCAGMAGIPFVAGIAPGQVVAYSSKTNDQVLLTPTIFTGMKNTWNAMLWQPGSYFADTINKSKADSLTKITLVNSSDYVNRSEVLTHLLALGGDLTPYKDEIARFAREKKDYPREVLKGAIIGLAVDNQEVFRERSQDFYDLYVNKFKDLRSSFIPWPRYAATYRQLLAMNRPEYKNKKSAFWQISRALAIQDWEDLPEGSSDSDYADSLPNYDGDNGVDYGDDSNSTSWDDIINSLLPPTSDGKDDLQDWSNVEQNDQLGRDTDDVIEAGARATLDKSSATACEKAQAIQTLITLNRVKSSELERFKQIVLDCANKCVTLEQCEGMGDIGDRWGSPEIINAANTQILVLLQQASDCDLAKKKGLSDYGNNACEIAD
jgi:hypothetical protein